MLPSVECSPRNAARVLALEEEGFCFAVLKAENLAITTDVELALQSYRRISTSRTTSGAKVEVRCFLHSAKGVVWAWLGSEAG